MNIYKDILGRLFSDLEKSDCLDLEYMASFHEAKRILGGYTYNFHIHAELAFSLINTKEYTESQVLRLVTDQFKFIALDRLRLSRPSDFGIVCESGVEDMADSLCQALVEAYDFIVVPLDASGDSEALDIYLEDYYIFDGMEGSYFKDLNFIVDTCFIVRELHREAVSSGINYYGIDGFEAGLAFKINELLGYKFYGKAYGNKS